ncbi:MAG: AAA family ATPase [Acidimicrobiales bacterium]
MSSRTPTVVLLAGRCGTGKSTFAPHLVRRLHGSVLDSDDIFDAPRSAVAEASGLGLAVVDGPVWRQEVHPRLLELLLALAACAASSGSPVVAVSPWTAMLSSPERFTRATSGLDISWRWVVLQAEPGVCKYRISDRARPLDASKLANWEDYDSAACSLEIPYGAYVVDTSFVRDWGPVAGEVAAWLAKTDGPAVGGAVCRADVSVSATEGVRGAS